MLFTRDDVRQCISGPVRASGGIMRTTVMELTRSAPTAPLTDIGITVEANFIPRAKGDADAKAPIRTVALPVRQRDKRVINPSRRWLLPFSPEGSSRV